MPSDAQMEAMWAACNAVEGDECEFVVERDSAVTLRDGLDRGFSAEAMEVLHFQMSAFVGTRVTRQAERLGLMPQRVRVVIKVVTDLDEVGS